MMLKFRMLLDIMTYHLPRWKQRFPTGVVDPVRNAQRSNGVRVGDYREIPVLHKKLSSYPKKESRACIRTKSYWGLEGPTSSAEATIEMSPSSFSVRQSLERMTSTVSSNSRFRNNQYTHAVPMIPTRPPANPRRKTERSVEGNIKGPKT